MTGSALIDKNYFAEKEDIPKLLMTFCNNKLFCRY